MNPESSTFGETLYEDSFQYFGDLYLLQDEEEEEDLTVDPTPTGVAGYKHRSTADLGGKISTSRVVTSGLDPSLQHSLGTYLNKASLIKTPEAGKSSYIIDRFDGGLNLNKSFRDLSYWESPSMNEMMPSKAGRLSRLGDFASTSLSLSSAFSPSPFDSEGYGLFYFTVPNIFSSPTSTGTLSKCIAYQDSSDINVRDITNNSTTLDVINATNSSNYKPVFHSALNKVYVSDASLTSNTSDISKNSQVFMVLDKLRYFPMESSPGNYNLGEADGSPSTYSALLKSQPLLQSSPTSGGSLSAGGVKVHSSSETSHGIHMHISFDNETTGSDTWTGADTTTDNLYYKFYASFIYDEDGSETYMEDVSGVIECPVTSAASTNRKLTINNLTIDWTDMVATHPRVHGCRFYYRAYTDSAATTPTSSEAYLFAELDFRHGLKLQQVGAGWHEFSDMSGDLTAITLAQTSGSNTLSLFKPPIDHTWYTLNLYFPGEIKKDLMWKCSAMGNGVSFIGNIKYDFLSDGSGGKHFPSSMLYCGSGEVTGGAIYPAHGIFPVDSNRIDMPNEGGEITALMWYSDRILQFRENILYVINVQIVTEPVIEGRYQGMGVSGQWAVSESPNGVAFVNNSGVYEYNGDDFIVRSLTSGRIPSNDFNSDSTSKIGYDDKSKLLIVGNYNQRASNYHYAYSYITDSWCTWNANASSYSTITNFAIDHDGTLTGAIDSSTTLNIYKWSETPTTTPSIEYITKDIDFENPSADKRLLTFYTSYIGGTNNSISISMRVNGKEGNNLTNNWISIGTIDDFTDPYGDSSGSAWSTTGTSTSGDPYIPSSGDGLDSSSTTEQKLAKISFRDLSSIISDTYPKNYLKFARSIQFKFSGTAAITFEINDISIVYKAKRLK